MATPKDLSRSVLHGSAEAVDSPCTLCQTRDRREIESINYCVDCDSNMCGACTRSHARFPAMASHQVVDISRAAGKPAQKLPLPTQRCNEHHGKLLDRYCEDHDVVACETCININHRNCKQLKYVPTFAKGISNTEHFEVTKRASEELLKALKLRRSLQRGTLQQLDKAEILSQQEVKEQVDIVHMYMDDLLISDLAKIASTYQEKKETVLNDMEIIDNQIDATEMINEKLINFALGENESELFVNIKQGEMNEKKALQVMDTICQADMAIPTYKVNSAMEMPLKDLASLGEFEKNSVAVKLRKEVNVRTQCDFSNCDIGGICVLPDASVILADYNNKSLKQLDTSYKIDICLDMCTGPFDVCCFNKDEVAVTLFDKMKVQFVRVGAAMKKTRSFPVDGKCAGICYSDNEFFICYRNPTSMFVRVHDVSGKALRTINHDSAGQPMFSGIWNITISACGKELHIHDRYKGILTMDKAGNLLSTYTDPELEGPGKICTLENGDLLVCGFGSNNVLHISKDGTKRSMVISKQDGIVKPQTACYDSVLSRLIVCEEDCDTINVFSVHMY